MNVQRDPQCARMVLPAPMTMGVTRASVSTVGKAMIARRTLTTVPAQLALMAPPAMIALDHSTVNVLLERPVSLHFPNAIFQMHLASWN